MTEELARLGIVVDSDGVLRSKERLEELRKESRRSEKANKSLGSSFSALGTAAKRAVMAIGVLGVAAAGYSLKVAASFETLKISLKTVTGSAEEAEKAFRDITVFTQNTPFQLEQVADAFIKLKAFGLDPSVAALESYGNTASAMGKSLNQMIEAVADAATGEFERLKEFGIKARSQGDKVSFTFQGVTTTIGKNAAEIERFLKGIGDVKFAGAMSGQMDTLAGAMSNAKDQVDLLAYAFSTESGLDKAAKDFLQTSSALMSIWVSDMPVIIADATLSIKELELIIQKGAAAITALRLATYELTTIPFGETYKEELRVRKEQANIASSTANFIENVEIPALQKKLKLLNTANADSALFAAAESAAIGDTPTGEATGGKSAAARILGTEEEWMQRMSSQSDMVSNHMFSLNAIMSDAEAKRKAESDANMTADQKMWASGNDGKVSVLNDTMGAISGLMMSGGKKQFEIGKKLGIANALVSTYQAVNNALAVTPFPLGLALAGTAMATGMMQVNAIRSQSFNGGGGGGGSVGSASAKSTSTPPQIQSQRQTETSMKETAPVTIVNNLIDAEGMADFTKRNRGNISNVALGAVTNQRAEYGV